MSFAARLARAEEVGLVREITEAAYAEHHALVGGKPMPVTERYEPRIEAGQVWIVSREGTAVGVAVLEPCVDHLLIFSLAARPGARGGAGRWMLGFAEERARAAGLGEVRLYTNGKMVRNIGVYGQAGYVETHRGEHPARPGWVMVHMAKRVAG